MEWRYIYSPLLRLWDKCTRLESLHSLFASYNNNIHSSQQLKEQISQIKKQVETVNTNNTDFDRQLFQKSKNGIRTPDDKCYDDLVEDLNELLIK